MPLGLGYAATVFALTEALVLGKGLLPFGSDAISGLAAGVAGNELQAALRDLYGKVAQTLQQANPAINHHLQRALARAFALASLHLVNRYGEWNGAPGPAADGLMPGVLAAAWRRVTETFRPISPIREADEAEARQLVKVLYPKLIALAKDPPLTDEPQGVLAEVYEKLQTLLARENRPDAALRARLLDEALPVLAALAAPRKVPPLLEQLFREHFAEAFFAAFREIRTSDAEARAVFDGILLSDLKSDTERILEIVTRLAMRLDGSGFSGPLEQARALRDCFGRERELEQLAARLLHPTAPVLVCSVHGLPGVGKSFLVDTLAWQRRADFPAYYRLTMDTGSTAATMLANLADRLGIRGEEGQMRAQVRATLAGARALVHVENVDSSSAAEEARQVTAALNGCRIVLTGRIRGLGHGFGWQPLALDVLEPADALAMLEASFRPPRDNQERDIFVRLVERLGRLPLAIHLAAGQLRSHLYTASDLLTCSALLDLEPEAGEGDDVRNRLRSSFRISLDVLAAREGEASRQVLAAFGWVPLAGVGESLGAAICGVEEPAFRRLVSRAAELSLVMAEEDPSGRIAWKTHALLAMFFRDSYDPPDSATAADDPGPSGESPEPFERMTAWFTSRIREQKRDPESQGRFWKQADAERKALEAWLGELPAHRAASVALPAQDFARTIGPYLAWAALCERGLAAQPNGKERSDLLWVLCNVLERAGDLGRALRAAQEKVRLDEERNAPRERALAWGKIADVLARRGEWEEALRIRRVEELPVYEKLGDVRSRAVTQGKIADVLARRGEWEEALRIRRVEELPVYEKLGDVRSRAVTVGKIADVLASRGEWEEALRIRREEQLPVYEKLGDVRSRAVTVGKIADVLASRGEWEEALRIRREEQLPVYEKLGDVRSRAVTVGKIADVLASRGEWEEALRIRREEQLPVYEKLGDVRARAVTLSKIASTIAGHGQLPEAIRLYEQEVMPVSVRLQSRADLAFFRANLADLLLRRAAPGDRDRAVDLLEQALATATELRMPIASQIRAILGRITQ